MSRSMIGADSKLSPIGALQLHQDLINRPIKELESHYINQSHEGDELLIKRVEEANAHVYVIKNGDTIICKAKLTFCVSYPNKKSNALAFF